MSPAACHEVAHHFQQKTPPLRGISMPLFHRAVPPLELCGVRSSPPPFFQSCRLAPLRSANRLRRAPEMFRRGANPCHLLRGSSLPFLVAGEGFAGRCRLPPPSPSAASNAAPSL